MNVKRQFRLAALLFFAVFSINAFAQQTVYINRDVKVIQYPDGWQIISGDYVLGHGDGILDIDNLPPAFEFMLENYATASKKAVSRSASKSDTVVYGPLLRTAWNQRSPYNDIFPTVNGNRTLAGCSTVSSSQLLYYFKYCKPINVEGENEMRSDITATDTIESPYFTSLDSTKYTYKYSYTPDFGKISTDDAELAKLFLGVAFAQKALFGLAATSTYDSKQYAAMTDIFGYKGERYSIKDLDDSAYIEKAIKNGMPIIISGESDDGGAHSFMIDGFNGAEYHVDYGWGGSSNGWFTTTTYNNDIDILIAQPDVKDAANIQSSPKYLYVKDVDNLVEQKLNMVKTEGGNLQYKLAEAVTLEPGEYEFYYEYADGSIVAPYCDSAVILNSSNSYTHYGLYVTTPARFKIAKTYNIDFWHDAGMAEVKVAVTDANVAISGKVMAADSTPLAGAVVTTADSIPVPEIACENISKRNSGYSLSNLSIPFIPSKKFLTKVDARVFIEGNPDVLTISVLDNNKKVLVEKNYPQSNFSQSWKWIGYELDAPLAVTPGQKYYINLSAFKDDNNRYYYQIDDNDKPVYQVFGTNDYFTTTDADGKYTFPVEKYSSGQLSAFLDSKEFDVVTFDNIAGNQTDKDIIQLGATVVEISGKVFNADSVPVESAMVTEASKPEIAIYQEHSDYKSKTGYRVQTDGSTIQSFVPQKNNIAKVDIDVFYVGNPGNLKVAILDKNKNEIGSSTINYTQIASDWTEIEFDQILKVTPNETHYIALTSDKSEANNRINHYFDSTDYKMIYRIWGYDNFTYTDANGSYTWSVDKNWSGTLHAYYNDKNFNNLTFTKIHHSDSVRNFMENAADTTFDYTLKSISLIPPTKTEYIMGESIDREGMVVTGTYGDGSTVKINNYVISGFTTDTVGEKTVTVSVKDLSETFKINVKTNKYSITYKVDSSVYKKLDYTLGLSVKVIEKPTKTGYTCIGWNPAVPARMPAEDLTVDAVWQINEYTLTYMVEDTVYQSVKVKYNDKIDSIAAPVKSGYLFNGWAGLPETMPDKDTTVVAQWQRNNFVITFDTQGGSTISKMTVEFNSIIVAPKDPTREGYIFDGWSPAIPTTGVTDDMTFTAIWVAEALTAVDDNAIAEINIWAYGNTIVVENATEKIFVYNAMGAVVGREFANPASTITINRPGLYIVKTGNTAKRVMVK
ncbi:MAG: C10 family peptidase [Salinivirgaceae bacterium]|nr:C10 family peptidase [Salinivirgaceae bacterium]